MTNRFPLIVDSVSQTIKELPSGDNLDLTGSGINGGTIDGTVIGGSTPAAISGTTGTFSGDVSIADKIIHTGDTNTALRFPAADTVTVETAGTERIRIDASGNFLVGTTDSNVSDNSGASNGGINIGTAGVKGVISAAAGQTVAYLNRLGSDGDIAVFRKDGTTVGSIGTSGDSAYVGGYQNAGIYFNGTTDIRPWNTSTRANLDNSITLGSSSARFKDLYLSGSAYTPVVQGLGDEAGLTFGGALVAPRKNNAASDGTVDLGASSARFKDLYLSGGVYLGGTGAANYLDDYEEGTWTPSFAVNGFTQTISSASGTYTKVGRQVTVTWKAALSSSGYMSGYSLISNLPFTVFSSQSSATGFYGTGDIALNIIGSLGYVEVSTADLYLYPSISTSNSTTWMGTHTYFTA